MAEYIALSKTAHSGFGYAAEKPFAFAGNWPFIPLSLAELGSVLPLYPICFQKTEAGFQVGLPTGLGGVNCLLHPHNGRFLLPYVPAILRRYPFSLLKNAEGQSVLCVLSEESGFSKGQGEAVISEAGELTHKGQALLDFLNNLTTSFEEAAKASAKLAELDLLVPLAVQFKDAQSGEVKTTREDLYRVDEQKLYQLSPEALKALVALGAMPLVYAHLFSLQRLNRISEAVQHFVKLNQQTAARVENLETFFGEADNDVLKFE